MSDPRQRGQTLVVFALCGAFVMLGLLALVGDNAVLQVHYNRIDEASVLAVQAASADIDVPVFVATHRLQLAADAEKVCTDVAHLNEPSTATVTCVVPRDRSFVRADIVDDGTFVLRLFGPTFALRASHTGRPAFGVTRPCQDPADPTTCA